MASNLALTIAPNQCEVCHIRTGLQRCSGCKAIFYCGREHQADHWARHKNACNSVKKALAALSQKEQMLKLLIRTGLLVTEDHYGRLGGTPETHDYMLVRSTVVDQTLQHFKNAEAVRLSIHHVNHMLDQCRSDKQGMRWVAPALYLRMGWDQTCYDFVKWWATTSKREEYDWDEMDEPYLDVKGTDVLEPPEALQLGHAVCVALIKVRIFLDLQHMLNATRAFERAMPREIIDKIRGSALVSGVVVSRKDILHASTETTSELMRYVKHHVMVLFKAVENHSPDFWPVLVDPDRNIERLLDVNSPQSRVEATITLIHNYDAWNETPGSIEVIKTLMNLA